MNTEYVQLQFGSEAMNLSLPTTDSLHIKRDWKIMTTNILSSIKSKPTGGSWFGGGAHQMHVTPWLNIYPNKCTV